MPYLRQFDGMPRAELEAWASKLGKENDQLRAELARFKASRALPGLGWDCIKCGAFTGNLKEQHTVCRCCGTPRPDVLLARTG